MSEPILLGVTVCEGCDGLAIVGLNEAPLCAVCFDDALARTREQIEEIMAGWERLTIEEIKSPLLC